MFCVFFWLLQNVWKQLFSRTPVWWRNTEAGTRGVLLKKVLLKNFMIFTGKHLRQSLFLIRLEVWRPAIFYKENPTQVFSCEYSKLFKGNFFKRTPLVAAFVVGQLFWRASANDCFCHQYHGNLRTRCMYINNLSFTIRLKFWLWNVMKYAKLVRAYLYSHVLIFKVDCK